ncbi:MAG: metallophosphoesterase, partial [Candidatus Babeliales bacterium]
MKRSSSYRSRRKSKFGFIKTAFKAVLILALLVVTVILLTPSPYFKDGFKNLKELQSYANQTNEQTPMENADTLRPEFTKYYQSQIPTFSQKIKNKIKLLLYLAGIKEKPVWSVSFFKTILENTEKSRKSAGHTDNLIYKIQTDPTSKFVIFGNMQGAFHSLVRCLNKIKELGIIGDDLKVTNSNNYIIFMGDLVDRSPFTLEILTLALKLIEANPQNVIYLRGNHEAKDYWQEHTLKTELQIRAAHLSKETIPLQKEVSSFFNTLPIAVYLTVPNQIAQSQFGQSIANE